MRNFRGLKMRTLRSLKLRDLRSLKELAKFEESQSAKF